MARPARTIHGWGDRGHSDERVSDDGHAVPRRLKHSQGVDGKPEDVRYSLFPPMLSLGARKMAGALRRR